jgi:hypothetical protein
MSDIQPFSRIGGYCPAITQASALSHWQESIIVRKSHFQTMSVTKPCHHLHISKFVDTSRRGPVSARLDNTILADMVTALSLGSKGLPARCYVPNPL